MLVARGDRDRSAAGPEVDGAGRGGCLVVTDVRGVAVPELALDALAPARNSAAGEDHADVLAPGGDRDRALTAGEAHGIVVGGLLPGVVADREGRRRGRGDPEPDLATVVQAPALDRVVRENRAGEGAAGADRLHRVAGTEVDHTDGGGRLVVADVVLVPVPEGAVAGLPPTLEGVVVEDRAVGLVADADRLDRPSCPEVHGSARGGRLVVSDVLGGSVAEPTEAAASPAANGRVVEQGAAPPLAGADLDRGSPGAEADGADRTRQLVVADIADRAEVPELAVDSLSPAAD